MKTSTLFATKVGARFGWQRFIAGLLSVALCGYAAAGQLKLPARPNGPIKPYPGTSNFYETIANGSDSRSALVFKPDGRLNGAAVILLHASGENQSQMANLTKAGRLAARGTVVVIPQALDNRGGEWNDSVDNASKTDDVGYISAVISTVVREYHVDPSRVTMAGYSNGGFMTARMVCERPELLHAAVLVSSNIWQAEQGRCKERPDGLRVSIIQGTADHVVPYEGKAKTGLPPANEAFAYFKSHRRGCRSTAASARPSVSNNVDDGTSVTRQDDGCGTELYTVQGGGHTWPGSDEPQTFMSRMLGKVSGNLDATGLVDSMATDSSSAPDR
jgi:polyhydroxybutyrate depolymerase